MREHLAIYANEHALFILFSGAFPTRNSQQLHKHDKLSPARLRQRVWMANELICIKKSEASSVEAGGRGAVFAVLNNFFVVIFIFFVYEIQRFGVAW